MARVVKNVDAKCLRWVINYRQADRMQQAFNLGPALSKTLIADRLDQHNYGSLQWTINQSDYIDKHGWCKWFENTDGPQGYQNFLNQRFKQDK